MNRRLALTTALLGIVLVALGCSSQPYGDTGANWVTLLDGTTGLDNWIRVGDANWRAVDGTIQADQKTDKANSFLVTKNSYTDFRVRAEFWVSDDANSGIYMRCADIKNLTDRTCYEANIFDQRPDPTFGTGSIVHLSPVSPMPKAGGKWNTYDVTVEGSRVTVRSEWRRHRRYSRTANLRRPDRVAIRGGCGQVPQGADHAALVGFASNDANSASNTVPAALTN
jgi:hypothetical protein